jgi:hypothetical protein
MTTREHKSSSSTEMAYGTSEGWPVRSGGTWMKPDIFGRVSSPSEGVADREAET